MTVLYVVSDQKGAGKTALCATLAHKMKSAGKNVSVFKPIPGAGVEGSDPDVDAYSALLGTEASGWPLEDAQDGFSSSLSDSIKGTFNQVAEGQDVVIVEGSNALAAQESSQVADAIDAKVVLIAGYQRELNGSSLTQYKQALGERLVGVVVNGLTKHLGTEARTNLIPSLESEGFNVLGIVPEDRTLMGVSVNQLTDYLGGRVLADEGDMGALVEYLMVGGMSLDPGEFYFSIHDNRAVIVRGDRPDIQMSALNTPSPTACMVLTNGIEPIEYVKYEAEEEEVPLILVETDTLNTMSNLNGLMDRAKFDHQSKLERYSALVDQNVDLPRIYEALA